MTSRLVPTLILRFWQVDSTWSECHAQPRIQIQESPGGVHPLAALAIEVVYDGLWHPRGNPSGLWKLVQRSSKIRSKSLCLFFSEKLWIFNSQLPKSLSRKFAGSQQCHGCYTKNLKRKARANSVPSNMSKISPKISEYMCPPHWPSQFFATEDVPRGKSLILRMESRIF